jgi:hypothetical protein
MHRLTFALLLIVAPVFLLAEEGTTDLAQKETAASPSSSPNVPPDSSNKDYAFPRIRGRAVVLEINTCIVEENRTVTWNESHGAVTIPGRPVGIKLVGANLVVTAQFTPYIPRNGKKFLVAQGQIWMDIPNQGIRYFTSVQTIPIEFDEPIYFFPLGAMGEGTSGSIEVMLTMHPYEDQ